MRPILIAFIFSLLTAGPCGAAEFLGATLCKGSVDTTVVLPVGSPLSLESAEIGRHGGLLLLLTSKDDDILDQIDQLMLEFTGVEGSGDEKKLQWAGNGITAFAQVIKNGYAALAVSSEDDCEQARRAKAEAVAAAAAEVEEIEPEPEAQGVELEAAAAAAATSIISGSESEEAFDDFELKGRLKHSQTEGSWVDVMGVVINRSGNGFNVANFDLSLYDSAGALICVDTISVSQLRSGQERAFRDSIRCADYVRENVASWKLQFAGGN